MTFEERPWGSFCDIFHCHCFISCWKGFDKLVSINLAQCEALLGLYAKNRTEEMKQELKVLLKRTNQAEQLSNPVMEESDNLNTPMPIL